MSKVLENNRVILFPPPTAPTVVCRDLRLVKISAVSNYVSVHQLSLHLWRLFLTPRVSVQKKIEHLGIRLHQCTKEQVCFLRKHGAVEGFRATMITLHDAEMLYDALKFSRERRDSNKKAKSRGSVCKSIVRINKKTPADGEAGDSAIVRDPSVEFVDECASHRNSPPLKIPLPPTPALSPVTSIQDQGDEISGDPIVLDTLLVAEAPIRLLSLYKQSVLKLLNDAAVEPEPSSFSASPSTVSINLNMLRSRQVPNRGHRDTALVQYPLQESTYRGDRSKLDNEVSDKTEKAKRCALTGEIQDTSYGRMNSNADSMPSTRSSNGLRGARSSPTSTG